MALALDVLPARVHVGTMVSKAGKVNEGGGGASVMAASQRSA